MIELRDGFGNEANVYNVEDFFKRGYYIIQKDTLFTNNFLYTNNENIFEFEPDIKKIYLLRRGRKPKKYMNCIDDILDLKNQGKSYKDIALIYDCSDRTIKDIVYGKYMKVNTSKLPIRKKINRNAIGADTYIYVTLSDLQETHTFFSESTFKYYLNLVDRIKVNNSKYPNRNVTTTIEKKHGIGYGNFYRRIAECGQYDEKISQSEFECDMKEMLVNTCAYNCLYADEVYLVQRGKRTKKISNEVVGQIKIRRSEGATYKLLEKEFKCSVTTLKSILGNRY